MQDYTSFFQMALSAEGFCKTAELIRTYVRVVDVANKKSIDLILKLFVPYTTNMALSCEFYIKALLLYKGIQYPKSGGKGHDLLELYNLLDKDDQAEVESYYSATTPILDFITEQRRVFTDHRYPHEPSNSPPPHYEPFESLMESLAHACVARQKKHEHEEAESHAD